VSPEPNRHRATPSSDVSPAFTEEGSAFLHLAPERHEVVVIGAGQTGLSVGYHLARRGVPFVILDANARVGDQWRRRWDSLRLFTPARFDGLPGMPFPAPRQSFPTKDEMADYLEAYAKRFALPVESNVHVERLSREGDRYLIEAGDRRFVASHVVVAMATYQKPRVPDFARELDRGIVQLHSSDYRNPGQLREGPVLVVGAGNSGAEIAREVAATHETWMAGRHTGHLPFRIDGPVAGRVMVPLVLRVLFHRIFTLSTPIGRRVRPRVLSQGGPLIRVKPSDLERAGVKRAARVTGVSEGQPVLADGRRLEVANVVWSTGFHPGFSWIDLPVLDAHGEPKHSRGVVEGEPGLYFVGLHFLYAFSSTMIHGADRDAGYVARRIANRR
jgi:putative flavoprotein involved in K+ transport